MQKQRLSALLGELEVPVRLMASDEGCVLEKSDEGLRTRLYRRAGDGGYNMAGEGTGGTDRHGGVIPPRRR